MELVINENTQQFKSPLTLAELLVELELSGKPVAVELNLELIPRDEHAETALKDGDQLEIVSLTGGG